MWYNSLVVKGEHPPRPLRKKLKIFQKTFKKHLTNLSKYGIISVRKARGNATPHQKKIKKIKKSCEKHLTNKVKCDII